MAEDIKVQTGNSKINGNQNYNAAVCINENLSRDYTELAVDSIAHIIFPKNLPIKITIAGVRTIVHVGEFAIIPPNCVFAINSSPERYCVDFDFDLIKNNPDFTVLLPIIANPCVYHPINTEQGLNTGYTAWYIHKTTQTLTGTYANATYNGTPLVGNNDIAANTENFTKNMNNYIYESPISPVKTIKEIVSILTSDKFHFATAYSSAKVLELYSLLGEEIIFSGFNCKHETAATSNITDNLSASVCYILSNYKCELNLEDVANVAGYSRSHYSKLFKEFYGISFYDYLLSVRVRSAALLLTSTESTIAEVGTASGFSSSSTLNRVFKQETGFSPRDYRKLFSKQP